MSKVAPFTLLCALALLTGCSVDRYLTSDKPLYVGSEIALENPDAAPDPDALEAALLQQVDQEASSKISIYWWYKLETERTKGPKFFLRKTLGSPPNLYDESAALRSKAIMVDYLKDHGYFGSRVAYDSVLVDSVRAKAIYTVRTQGRSVIDTIEWPADTSSFAHFLQRHKEGSLLKVGGFYTIAALNAERARIDQIASRDGFFEFSSTNVFYYVDSTEADKGVGVYMRLDSGTDTLALSRYRIGSTYVFPDYSLSKDSTAVRSDTAFYQGIAIMQYPDDNLRPAVIGRRIQLREGELYDKQIYENTLNQLLDLGVFKFVNYEFKRRLTDSLPVLDQYIYLTQGQTQEVNVDFSAATQTGAQPGIGVTGRYSNGNLFNGAEKLDVSVSVGVEPQTSTFGSDDSTGNNLVQAQQFAASVSLGLPRLYAPFARRLERNAFYIPRTLVNLNTQYTLRPDFDLVNYGVRLGYKYRANQFVSHELYPVSASYTSFSNQSLTFEKLIRENPRLLSAFEDNAIIGLEYLINYTEPASLSTNGFWTVEGGLKTSGNVAQLLANSEGKIGNVSLSQFAKLYVDARRTFQRPIDEIATRLYVGAAVPYGLSDVIPYIEQFYVGGPNSMRAFALRGLGPGRIAPNTSANGQSAASIDRTGDIRIELNAEYRFDIVPYVEGAVFTDIGNVWTYSDVNPEPPIQGEERGVFEFKNFYKELAVGAGAGIRLNFDIIIVRVDFALPMYKPYLLDPTFGKDVSFDDLKIQFAIGYPF